jgi:hypothetical protein
VALGPDSAGIQWLMVRRGRAPVVVGLAIGVAAAMLLERSLELIVRRRRARSEDLPGSPLVLLAAAALGCYIPSVQASRADPVRVLQHE